MKDYELGEFAHEWEDEHGSGNKPFFINRVLKKINNYDVSYTNIIFWLENPTVIIKLVNIENGTIKKEWCEAKKNSDGVITINEGWRYKNYPEDKDYTIEYLMKDRMGIENIPYFINYFDRHVRVWHSYYQEGNRDENGRTEFSGEYAKSLNYYPIDIELFLEISKLSSKEYNIDMIVDDALVGKEIVFENYKTKKEEVDFEILKEIISLFPGKIDEYKKGKTNLINLFLGEYLKRLKDKNVDKAMLLTGIKNFIEHN